VITIIIHRSNPEMMTLKLPSISSNWHLGAVMLSVAILTITIGTMPATAQQEDTVNIAFEPAEDEVKQNTAVTYDVVVEGVSNGIGTYQFTVENSDTQLAEITDAELVAYGGGLTNISVADDGSEVLIEEATLGQEDPSGQEYVLATVTIETTDSSGENTFSINQASTISDNDVEVYNLTMDRLAVEITNEKRNTSENTIREENGQNATGEENGQNATREENGQNATGEENGQNATREENGQNTTSENETPGFGILLTIVSLVGSALLIRQNN
jgi:PGF-CTERM protein